jgi:hypothetical protein
MKLNLPYHPFLENVIEELSNDQNDKDNGKEEEKSIDDMASKLKSEIIKSLKDEDLGELKSAA